MISQSCPCIYETLFREWYCPVVPIPMKATLGCNIPNSNSLRPSFLQLQPFLNSHIDVTPRSTREKIYENYLYKLFIKKEVTNPTWYWAHFWNKTLSLIIRGDANLKMFSVSSTKTLNLWQVCIFDLARQSCLVIAMVTVGWRTEICFVLKIKHLLYFMCLSAPSFFFTDFR